MYFLFYIYKDLNILTTFVTIKNTIFQLINYEENRR